MSDTSEPRITRRLQLEIGGKPFGDWESCTVTRSLEEISGSFELAIYDTVRAAAAMGRAPAAAMVRAVMCGSACRVLIDEEPVLVGWIDEIKVSRSGDSMSVSVSGRDATGDLVDCSAAPDGPAEYRGLTLTEIARRLCQPFGIPVRADVDVGAPIPAFALDASETVLSALEKAARQRGVLVASDGIGGLVLTRGGASRGPSPIVVPGMVTQATVAMSWRERFRDYIVKGQTRAAGGQRATESVAAPLTAATPPSPPAAPARPAVRERAGVVMTGRAHDPEVTRYRPRVEIAKSQGGGASVQVQAEWRRRVAAAKSSTLGYTLPDWRAGEERRLWRPNELVAVDDAAAGVNGDMLISSVVYTHSDRGEETRLELVGPEAFDLEPVEPRQRGRQRQSRAAGAETARPLTAEPVTAPPPPPARRR